MKVSFFDASPGADYGNLGAYEVPAVPQHFRTVRIGPLLYEVRAITHWPETGAVFVYLTERRPKQGWFRFW